MSTMKFSDEKKVIVGFFISLLIALFAIGGAIHVFLKYRDNTLLVIHTHNVQQTLQSVISSLKDAETGQRGYLITGKESYLEPYNTAINSIDDSIARLIYLTKDNQSQQIEIPKLKRYISSKITELSATIAVRREQGFDNAKQIVLTNLGKWEMDEIRQIIKDMHIKEDALLEDRNKSVFYNLNVFYSLIVSLSIISILGLYLIKKYLAIRRKSEKMIQDRENRYRSLVESTDNSIYLVDKNFNYLFINKNHLERIGANENQYIGQPFSAFHSQEETELFIEKAEKVFKAGKPIRFTYKSFREDKYWLQTYSPIMGKGNEPVAITVMSKDITELKHMEEELRALSLKDDLTNLYNRRGFTTLAEQYLKMAKRDNEGFFMLYADLDNLKGINDKFGHLEGDFAIIQIANILTDTYREADIIARLGGDEFAVIPVAYNGDNINIIISRLQDNIKSYNAVSNHSYELSLSVGTSYFDPKIPSSLDQMLSKADEEMYEQKKNKKTLTETPMTSSSK